MSTVLWEITHCGQLRCWQCNCYTPELWGEQGQSILCKNKSLFKKKCTRNDKRLTLYWYGWNMSQVLVHANAWWWYTLLRNENLPRPSSQRMPVNDAAHAHLNPLITSVHVPPFRHGLLAHSSISALSTQINLSRVVSLDCQKVIRFALTTLYDWRKKSKPIVTCSHTFLRALGQLHIITSDFDWVTELSVLIG